MHTAGSKACCDLIVNFIFETKGKCSADTTTILNSIRDIEKKQGKKEGTPKKLSRAKKDKINDGIDQEPVILNYSTKKKDSNKKIKKEVQESPSFRMQSNQEVDVFANEYQQQSIQS